MTSYMNLELVNQNTLKDTVFDTIIVHPHNSIDPKLYLGFLKTKFIRFPISILSDTTTLDVFYITSIHDTTKTLRFDTISLSPLKIDTTIIISYPWKKHRVNTETVTVLYKPVQVFVSYDCGFRTDFKLDTVYSSTGIDNIRIYQKNISNLNEINCKVFFNLFTGK